MVAYFKPANWDALVQQVAATCAAAQRPVYFLQIGAMDGVQFDPLHRHIKPGGWAGTFVEPMPFHMTALQQAYQGLPDLHFIQAAVVAHDGPVSMTYLPPETVQANNIKPHAAGMGCVDYSRSGFAKQTAAGQAVLQPLLQQCTVRGVTLATVLQESQLPQLDIYVSDTEGYDAIILQQLDVTRWQPQLILIEHEHLSPAEKVALIVRFRPLGYREFFAQDNSEDLLFVAESLAPKF